MMHAVNQIKSHIANGGEFPEWMQNKLSGAHEKMKGLYSNISHDEEVELDENADKSLAKKAEASGISVSILKQVYKRGVAAWRTGHRVPGTTPEQWGHARVNSFITGGKTRTTADADLWKKHKGKSEETELDEKYELYHKSFLMQCNTHMTMQRKSWELL